MICFNDIEDFANFLETLVEETRGYGGIDLIEYKITDNSMEVYTVDPPEGFTTGERYEYIFTEDDVMSIDSLKLAISRQHEKMDLAFKRKLEYAAELQRVKDEEHDRQEYIRLSNKYKGGLT